MAHRKSSTDSALLVSASEKSVAFFSEMLKNIACDHNVAVSTSEQARQRLTEREFDYCVVNAPLPDESGESLALAIAKEKLTQVILVVQTERFASTCEHVEDWGVITAAKPIHKPLFRNAIKLAAAARRKVHRLQTENSELLRRIEDISLINRAKWILLSVHSMTEPQAHKYIEKQAMDMRMSKRAVAEGILKTYEI
jgi:response regulator NasT